MATTITNGVVLLYRRVEEFKEYGDMDMMMQYVKEVQSVQKKLSDSVESIGFINEVCLFLELLSIDLSMYDWIKLKMKN